MDIGQRPNHQWMAIFRQHVIEHPYIAAALATALTLVIVLLVQSLIHVLTTDSSLFTRYALLGGSAGFIATALGALPALMLKRIPQAAEDAMLGFAAGMMLAASAFSLLLPGIEAGTELLQSATQGGLIVVFGMFMGVALMLGLDEFTPHEHDKTGPCGPGHERCGKAWLFVFAIALHNLPEGMRWGSALPRAI